MNFGVKVKDDKGGGGGGRFISYPKEGDNSYRFLEEISEWTKYYEHFDKSRNISYPCNDKRSREERLAFEHSGCPGCEDKRIADMEAEQEGRDSNVWGASKRYLVNVLTDEGYVNLVKLPASILDDMLIYESRFGTVTDRDYIVTKFQREGRWKYSTDRGEMDKTDLTQYQSKLNDHQTALMNAWVEAWGDGDVAVAQPRRERQATTDQPQTESASSGPHLHVAKDPQEDRKSSWADAPHPDDPPSEPARVAEPVQEPEADETREVSESELRDMEPADLRQLIIQCGLEAPEALDTSDELADFLIEQLATS